jgi:Tol biopolymer transport system component
MCGFVQGIYGLGIIWGIRPTFCDTIAGMLSIILSLLLTGLPSEGTIAFIEYTDAPSQIYVYDFATETTSPIGPSSVRGPLRWSPDGQWLACTVVSEQGESVCLIPSNGEAPILVKHAQAINQLPRWHDSGTKLAYQSGVFPETTIRVYDLASKTESTWGGEDATGLMRPVWLHRTDFIRSQVPITLRETLVLDKTSGLVAVQVQPGDHGWTTQLSVLSLDKVFPFTEEAYEFPDEEHTEWAVEPDAKDRAFVYESNDGGDRELFLVHKNRVLDLSNHAAADVNPVWSPDGKWVAFESYRNGQRGIYRAHRDSGRVLDVVHSDSVAYWSPSWSPDSATILCVGSDGGRQSIVVCDLNSKTSDFLEIPQLSMEHPAWKP